MQSIYLDEVGYGPWLRGLFLPPPGFGWDTWIGNWVAALLTLAIFSFLIGDNRIFKLAEHIFIGSATGYLMVRTLHDSVVKLLWTPFFQPPVGGKPDWWLIVPMILGVMTLAALIPAVSWGVRWPLAFFAGVGIGSAVIGFLQANIIDQVRDTIGDLRQVGRFYQNYELKIRTDEEARILASVVDEYRATPSCDQQKAIDGLALRAKSVLVDREWIPASAVVRHVVANGAPATGTTLAVKERDWMRPLNSLLMVIGVVTGLIYFFFSVEHRGVVFGTCSRIGIWFMMISFGASFGYTVMARISLLIGRLQFLFGDWLHLQSSLSSLHW